MGWETVGRGDGKEVVLCITTGLTGKRRGAGGFVSALYQMTKWGFLYPYEVVDDDYKGLAWKGTAVLCSYPECNTSAVKEISACLDQCKFCREFDETLQEPQHHGHYCSKACQHADWPAHKRRFHTRRPVE
jgi:hypothetical protein